MLTMYILDPHLSQQVCGSRIQYTHKSVPSYFIKYDMSISEKNKWKKRKIKKDVKLCQRTHMFVNYYRGHYEIFLLSHLLFLC